MKDLITRMYDGLMSIGMYGTFSTSSNTSDSSITAEDLMASIRALKDHYATEPKKITIYTNPYLTLNRERQSFIPRSKKKRIIKKCKKLYTVYYEEPNTEHVYYMKSKEALFCHPAMKKIIEIALKQGQALYKLETE